VIINILSTCLLLQFAKLFANLELAKLLLIGLIVKGGVLVILAGFYKITIIVNLSHSVIQGISCVLCIIR
jgi:hypothetical protein